MELEANITARRKTQNELLASEIRYRRLFESAKDGILILDANTGQVVDANPFLLSLLGYSHAELRGKALWELGPFRDIAISMDTFKELQDREYVRYDDLPLETRDGRVVNVEFVSNVYWVGEAKVIQCNIRDITDRKRAEEKRWKLEGQLHTSQKMEAIGLLAGGIAHDFNNLLSVILGFSELAMLKVGDGDPIKEDLVQVRRAGERATVLIRQLLAFSRKQILRPVPLNLNHVAGELEKMLRRIVGEDIDLVHVLAPDLGGVSADPAQIEQVLMNLVVNARDAMAEGGTLTVETSNVDIGGEYAPDHVGVPPGPYVLLTVADTGCGMDEQLKMKIFDPFFTTKEKGKGTGLGLSTVHGIVEQSGGTIRVHSEPGRGTRFKIYLPRTNTIAEAGSATRSFQEPTKGTETILVVEDEDALCRVVKRSLAAVGYSVLTAASGDEALGVAERHDGTIHLLLTDVVMPRMGGTALAEALVKSRPATKVLFMSGYVDNALAPGGVVGTGTNFIGKPFTATEVARKVRDVLDA